MATKWRRYIAVSLLLVVAFALTAKNIAGIKVMERPTADHSFPWSHVDLLPVWLGSRMILHRENPYSDRATQAIQVAYFGQLVKPNEKRIDPEAFAYPAYTAFFAAPLALLPWKAVSIIALFAMFFATLASVPAWLRVLDIRLSRQKEWLYIGAVIVSWPALWGLRCENISLLVLPMVAVASWCLLEDYPVVAGVLFAASAIKPQLVFLLLPWLVLRSALRREWRFLISFGSTLAVSLSISILLLPHWIGAWLGSLTDYVTYTHVAPLLPAPLNLAAIGIAALFLWSIRRADLRTGISFTLAAAYVLAPSIWATSYNMLCVLPGCLLLLESRFTGRVIWLRAIAVESMVLEFLLVPIGFALQSAYPTTGFGGVPGCNFLLPIAVTVALGGVLMSSGPLSELARFRRISLLKGA